MRRTIWTGWLVVVLVLAHGVGWAQEALKVDPALPPYKAVSGVSVISRASAQTRSTT